MENIAGFLSGVGGIPFSGAGDGAHPLTNPTSSFIDTTGHKCQGLDYGNVKIAPGSLRPPGSLACPSMGTWDDLCSGLPRGFTSVPFEHLQLS